MLTHRTEYQISVNGSGWGAYVNSVWTADAFTVLANEEECGSYARSIGPLTTGSYNIRLRVTSLPETALSTVLYTETGVFLVNNTTLSYATTSQPVQSSIANGSLKLTAAGVEYQITQTNVAAASLSITGAAVTSQPTQNIYANGPLPLVGTVITDNKVQTESITGVVVIYGTVDQSQKTQTEIVSGTVATVTPSVSITSGTALQVVLDWADYAANTTFDVYRHTSSFTPPGTGTKVGNALTVSTFTELTTAATYYYRVIAVSASGSSVPSNQISVTTAAAGDTTAPSVTAFTLGTVSGLTVPVSSFTATDAVGVTGYVITENSTVPAADGSNLSTTTADSTHAKSSMTAWVGTAPTSYTTAEAGTKTLYAWAKDAAGNVSTGAEVTGNVFTSGGSNIFTNPTFETDLSGWSTEVNQNGEIAGDGKSSVTRITSGQITGNGSAKLEAMGWYDYGGEAENGGKAVLFRRFAKNDILNGSTNITFDAKASSNAWNTSKVYIRVRAIASGGEPVSSSVTGVLASNMVDYSAVSGFTIPSSLGSTPYSYTYPVRTIANALAGLSGATYIDVVMGAESYDSGTDVTLTIDNFNVS